MDAMLDVVGEKVHSAPKASDYIVKQEYRLAPRRCGTAVRLYVASADPTDRSKRIVQCC